MTDKIDIKALIGTDWQTRLEDLQKWEWSRLLSSNANGETLVDALGLKDRIDPHMATLAKLDIETQAAFAGELNQVIEYSMMKIRAEIDRRFSLIDTIAL